MPESRPTTLDFPSPDSYTMAGMTDDLVHPGDHAALTRNQQVQVTIEQRMGWDQSKDEERLEAAKQVMGTIDTLMEGHTWDLSDIGPGQYAGEGQWLLLGQTHAGTSRNPHAEGALSHKGYSVKQKEIDLHVRQYEDRREYTVRLPYSETSSDQPLEITVDRQGVVQAMTRRPNVRWEKADSRPEWVPTAASLGRIEYIRGLLQPKTEQGQTLRHFEPEREVVVTHPDNTSEVRIYKRNLLGLLGRAASGVKDLVGRLQ